MDRCTTNTSRLKELHPEFAGRVQKLLAYMEGEGYPLSITQGLRTWQAQDALYAQGRTVPGKIVTRAYGGYSHHNFGLAVDLCPVFTPGAAAGTERIKADATLSMRRSATSVPAASPAVTPAGGLDWNADHPAWKKLLAIAPSFGLAEGARWRSFPDSPHFYPVEIPAGTAKLRELYQAGGMQAVWEWFDGLAGGNSNKQQAASNKQENSGRRQATGSRLAEPASGL